MFREEIVVLAVVFLIAGLFDWAFCSAAARADRQEERRKVDGQKTDSTRP